MTSAVAAGFAVPAYKPTLRWFHWCIAILIFAAIALGVTAIYLPRGDVRTQMLAIHKAIGMTVLLLVVLRVLARISLGAPNYVPPLDAFTRYASELGHLALYALMFAMPISGYVDQTADGHPISWFGLFTFPMMIPRDPALGKQASEAHYIFAWCMGAMLVAHIGAALWHALVRRDNVLARMWPRAGGA